MVGGRIRKPTARVLDSVESRQLLSSLSHERRRAVGHTSAAASTSATAQAQATTRSAPVKRKGKAQNARGKQAVAKEQGLANNQHDPLAAALPTLGQDSAAGDDEDDQDMTLYCVCLGYDTGEQPMIQCEHCSNWFHFSCVGLTDGLAAGIEAYSCDMCEQMGMGSTRMIGDAPTSVAPSATFYDAGGDAYVEDDDDEDDIADEEEEEEQDDGAVDDNDESDADFDAGDGQARSQKRKRPTTGARSRSRRKVAESDESDDDWDSDEDAEKPKKPRAKRPSATGNRRASSSHDAKAAASAAGSSVPASDKTRTHVRKQLTSIFSSIFAADADADAKTLAQKDEIELRSTAFAEQVEAALFEAHAEPDDKGVRAPRTRYASKFRSLHFNLKSNAYLRSRVANNELPADKLINLSAEDLQTPELRAMAESVRAASLRNSVKEVLAAPTAKRTHKGEEEIENEASRIIVAEQVERVKEAQAEEARKRGEDANAGSPRNDDSPMATSAFPYAMEDSPGPQSSGAAPNAAHERQSDSPAATTRARSSLVPNDASPGAGETAGSPTGLAGDAAAAGSPPAEQGDNDMSPPPAPPKPRQSASNFDITSIWGKVKAASPDAGEKSQSPAPAGSPAADQDDAADHEEHDLFQAASGGEDDDFEDDLFRDSGASPKKPSAAKPRKPTKPAVTELPKVWSGDVLVPEEGGFPSFAAQVGGRPLGDSPTTWKQLFPRALSTAGRLPTEKAVKYLVECSLAPTRELVVTALLPDTTGPSAEFPHKPTEESCLAKHRHIYDTYLKRDRAGVVQPGREFARLVKDIYIVPLPKDAPLPEYLELADEHVLSDDSPREEDLLLCVLVVQKGALPTVRPTAPAPGVTETAAPQPVSTSSSSAAPPIVQIPPGASPQYPGHPPAFHGGGQSPPYAGSQSPYAPPSYPAPGVSAGYSTAGAPTAQAVAPAPGGVDLSAMQSLLSQVDPATIDSLLANPALLNSIPGFGAAAAASGIALPTAAPPTPGMYGNGPPAGPSPMQGGYSAGPATMYGGYASAGPAGYGQSNPSMQPPMQSAGFGGGAGGGPPVHPSRMGMVGGGGAPTASGAGGPPVHPSRLAMMNPGAAVNAPTYGQQAPNHGWGGPGPHQGGYGRY